MIVTKFFLATIIIMSLLVFARHLSLTLLTLKWSLSESVNDLYLSDTFRATFLDRKVDRQTDRIRMHLAVSLIRVNISQILPE